MNELLTNNTFVFYAKVIELLQLIANASNTPTNYTEVITTTNRVTISGTSQTFIKFKMIEFLNVGAKDAFINNFPLRPGEYRSYGASTHQVFLGVTLDASATTVHVLLHV